MTHRESIKKKFDQINLALKEGEEGMPPLSISVGVAFSQNGYSDELFKQADGALYQAKEAGRNTCRFYEK